VPLDTSIAYTINATTGGATTLTVPIGGADMQVFELVG
jgi:hypothetical protein